MFGFMETNMEFAYYSLSVILGYAITRWLTENIKFHIRSEKIWLHHWIIASITMGILVFTKVESPLIWGTLTGVALEGLSRKNWSIRRIKK